MNQPIIVRNLLLAAVFAVVGCASAPNDEPTRTEEDDLTTYDELFTTLEAADLDRWRALRSKLEQGFDRSCGDTICSGDYSNLTTVRLTCSSTVKMRKMKDCSWVLGGSIEHVEPNGGAITTDAHTFSCKIPVAGSAKKFLSALEAAGDDPLHTRLPGTNGSFYDGLVACFAGVKGGPPPAPSPTPAYVELGDWLETSCGGPAWSDTKRRLNESFDSVCGDTFCEGDYSDITGLRFVCAVNASTKLVTSCSWSFAAANTSVDRKGMVVASATTFTCPVAVDAEASALTTALAGPDPLHAPLPQRTTSIYDALAECL